MNSYTRTVEFRRDVFLVKREFIMYTREPEEQYLSKETFLIFDQFSELTSHSVNGIRSKSNGFVHFDKFQIV